MFINILQWEIYLWTYRVGSGDLKLQLCGGSDGQVETGMGWVLLEGLKWGGKLNGVMSLYREM
jgi:hypothetical protein